MSALLFGTGAQSQDVNASAPVPPEIDYAMSVFQGIFFHEIGHAVIGTTQFPVLGYEEDAVDGFSQLALTEFYGNEAADLNAYVPQYIDFWRQTEYEETSRGPITKIGGDILVGSHDFSTRRAARLACNIAGSAPHALSEIAASAGISRETLDAACVYSSALMFSAWQEVLDTVRPSGHLDHADASEDPFTIALGLPFDITYRPWSEKPETVKQLQDSMILEDSVAFLRSWIELPTNVRVVAASCGMSNAFYDPRSNAVLMCYELWDEAIKLGKSYASRTAVVSEPTSSP